MEKLLQHILQPSEEFTPIPFWFFNDDPDEEKIETQLRDYVEKGVHGFVLHPRIGIPESVPYLSGAYFKAVRFIVKTAAKLHMRVVLYDEGMYPSGSAHGMVAAANPEFASRGIKLVTQKELPAGAEPVAELPGGKYLIYTFTGGNIRGIHFGEDDGQEGAPASADILNPDAVDLFIRLTHDRYYEELKEYFGDTIIAFFTDEPCALGRNAGAFREWVPGMEKELTEAGGRLEELEGLFTGQENKTTMLYHKLIKKYLREIFYARLSDWCQAHGIALMGHPEASDDVEEELYFQIPGQDLIMRRVAPESGGLLEFDSVQAKLPADIARHLGRRRNANECFGVCCRENISWYFTGRDMKWYIDWLGVRGVNLFVPHAFYYSVEGKRKEERPPDVGPNNIWWPHYRKFSDYIKRLSFLMTDSRREARVAVLCDNNRVPYKETACLYENQIDFHYLPVAFLKNAGTEGGRLHLGEYTYDAVLNVIGADVPFETVTNAEALPANQRLHTVLTDDPCPGLRAVSLIKEGGRRMYLFSNEGQEEIITRIHIPRMNIPRMNIPRMNIHRMNIHRCACESDACAEDAGNGENSGYGAGLQLVFVDLWRGMAWKETAESGRDSADSGEKEYAFSLRLQSCETRLVLLDSDGELAKEVPKKQPENFLGDFTERFVLEKKAENKAVYSMRLTVDRVCGNESFLARGEEMAECFCNGRLADVSFSGPHRLCVGPYLKPGENEITLVMTGNAANLFCDADIWYGLGKG